MVEIITTNQSVANGAIIPLETTNTKIGNTVSVNGNTLVINAPGTYKIEVSETGTLAGAGDVNNTLYINGVASTSALATNSLTAAGTASISYACILTARPAPTGTNIVLSFYNAGLLTTINTMDIIVTRISPQY